MKKIFFLFAGAIASFLILAHIDEYESLILPFMAQSGSSFAGPSDRVNNEVLKIIRDFNTFLADAYLKSNPSLLPPGAIDEGVRASVADEINYLTREGKVMEIKTKDIEIEKVEFLSSNLIRAITRETVGLRYLNMSKMDEDVANTETKYKMAYTLTMAGNKWKITSYETRSVIEPKP